MILEDKNSLTHTYICLYICTHTYVYNVKKYSFSEGKPKPNKKRRRSSRQQKAEELESKNKSEYPGPSQLFTKLGPKSPYCRSPSVGKGRCKTPDSRQPSVYQVGSLAVRCTDDMHACKFCCSVNLFRC